MMFWTVIRTYTFSIYFQCSVSVKALGCIDDEQTKETSEVLGIFGQQQLVTAQK